MIKLDQLVLEGSVTAYLDAMKRYFDFTGRSSRSQYWLFVAIFIAMMFAAALCDALAGNLDGRGPAVFLGIVNIAHLVPIVSVTVRRLHDSGRSGWWLLLSVVPIVGQIILLVWLCTPSQPEANRFSDLPTGDRRTLPQRAPNEPQMHREGADLDRLEKLAALKASGALSETEFDTLKAETLAEGSLR
jgi:uncharacterized membrane protein YhaH (DUF805 family)